MKKINIHSFLSLAIVISIFAASSVFAQDDSSSKSKGGSFYSLFGLGFPTDNNTARELGLGIPGVSLDNSQSNSLYNPALWGKNVLTTTSSGFLFSKFNSSDNNTANENSSLQANYLQLTLPIYREKFGISASLYPVTRSNYQFTNTTNTIVTPEDDTINYRTETTGSGGVNKLEIGFGWTINKNFAFGYAPSLAFVSQKTINNAFFDRIDYGNTTISNKITGSSFSHRFGALLSFQNIISSDDRITIGSSFILPVEISVDEKIVSTKQVNGRDREVTLNEQSGLGAKLPAEWTGGVTYYPSNLFNISLEGKLQTWSEAESSINSNTQSLELSDRTKLGLGAEYHPYKTNSTSFLSNFRYSGGVSFDSGHLSFQGDDINTLWFSAGLGIISPFSNSTIDISAQYGLRGTTSNNLVREKIWALNLSVNLTELMFFRPKLN
ncbi:hypothetical protein [Gracilimonas sp.]|uniref:hypothetical protein n=1 Tax=Gracilimonas sp. TaxID=1974203 RepID=UPI0028716E35|nr:hypothetical protein [Gracilimonas sp.]